MAASDSAASPTPSAISREGCEPRPSPGAGPVTDPQGPYYHQVVVAQTTDGVTLTGARQVLDHASVPDGVRLPDGSLRIYYVNGADGGIWVAQMEGNTVTPLGPVSIDGVARPAGAVDLDATLMPDGKVRLAYFGSFGPPGRSQTFAMCLAESTDGVSFTLVGRAIAFTEMTTDPSLVRLSDGSWLMAVSQGQKTALARSADGLRFEQYDTVSFGGVPELALTIDGRVRLYVCARGIESYVSSDAGRTWQREGTVLTGTPAKKIACDPSLVAGAGVFIYKTAE